jgi:predicted RecB family endonuclease
MENKNNLIRRNTILDLISYEIYCEEKRIENMSECKLKEKKKYLIIKLNDLKEKVEELKGI